MKRKMIVVDQDKCDGCGLCIPNCPEGALQILDGKARLVSEFYCDGLGACVGHCPQNALHVQEKEALPYDEARVLENIIPQGQAVIDAHLNHLASHNQQSDYEIAVRILQMKNIRFTPVESVMSHKKAENIPSHDVPKTPPHHPPHSQHTPPHAHGGGCPGGQVRILKDKKPVSEAHSDGDITFSLKSQLRQWPVQISLVPVQAPHFHNASLLVTADCVPFAYANYHPELLKGKSVLIGCPKLDDVEFYIDKLTAIVKSNDIKDITVAFMEVPCCSGIVYAVEQAVKASGKPVPIRRVRITIDGEKMEIG